ncbi:MAG: signal transduction histidine kinase [Gammaproteobacteria bacterium]
MLSNLLDNAVQHAGVDCAVRITAEILPTDDHEHVRITVADNGPGISSGNREHTFQLFFTTARATGGTGLGLALVQSLLKAYRGTIELVSCEQGTTFSIVVPLADLSTN